MAKGKTTPNVDPQKVRRDSLGVPHKTDAHDPLKK